MTALTALVVTGASIAGWVVIGVLVTTVFSFARLRLDRKPLSENDLAWLVAGWPLTFFATLGVLIRLVTKQFGHMLGQAQRTEVLR